MKLIYLFDEPGAMAVWQALEDCAAITAAYWAEALSEASDYGHDPDRVADGMIADGFIGGVPPAPAWRWEAGGSPGDLRRALRSG